MLGQHTTFDDYLNRLCDLYWLGNQVNFCVHPVLDCYLQTGNFIKILIPIRYLQIKVRLLKISKRGGHRVHHG